MELYKLKLLQRLEDNPTKPTSNSNQKEMMLLSVVKWKGLFSATYPTALKVSSSITASHNNNKKKLPVKHSAKCYHIIFSFNAVFNL